MAVARAGGVVVLTRLELVTLIPVAGVNGLEVEGEFTRFDDDIVNLAFNEGRILRRNTERESKHTAALDGKQSGQNEAGRNTHDERVGR